MAELLQRLLGVLLVIFMVGSMLDIGLNVSLGDVRKALGNGRFSGLTLLWAFVLCPALAYALVSIFPLAEPYALGLLFLGMAPGAPFLPLVARKARGDMSYVAAFMLLASVGTLIEMPLLVPLLVTGFAASAWAIARPLLYLLAVPLAVGMALRGASVAVAEKACPVVRRVTGIDTMFMLILILAIYGRDFLGAVGSFAMGAQVLFCTLVAVASYRLALGLPHSQKSVLALGITTRNIGAAIVPLYSVADTDRRAITMCALAIPVTVIISLVASRVLARNATSDQPGPGTEGLMDAESAVPKT